MRGKGGGRGFNGCAESESTIFESQQLMMKKVISDETGFGGNRVRVTIVAKQPKGSIHVNILSVTLPTRKFANEARTHARARIDQ